MSSAKSGLDGREQPFQVVQKRSSGQGMLVAVRPYVQIPWMLVDVTHCSSQAAREALESGASRRLKPERMVPAANAIQLRTSTLTHAGLTAPPLPPPSPRGWSSRVSVAGRGMTHSATAMGGTEARGALLPGQTGCLSTG